MGRQVAVVLYVVAKVGLIAGVDILLFRHHFWARLTVNVGIVLVFGAFLPAVLEGNMNSVASSCRAAQKYSSRSVHNGAWRTTTSR